MTRTFFVLSTSSHICKCSLTRQTNRQWNRLPTEAANVLQGYSRASWQKQPCERAVKNNFVAVRTQEEFLVNFRFSGFAVPQMTQSRFRLQENFYQISSTSEENSIFCIFETDLISLAVRPVSRETCSVHFMWLTPRPGQPGRAGGNALLFVEWSATEINQQTWTRIQPGRILWGLFLQTPCSYSTPLLLAIVGCNMLH